MILHKQDGSEIEIPISIELEGTLNNSCHVLVSWVNENGLKQCEYVKENLQEIKNLISKK